MPLRTCLALVAGLLLPLACGLIREDELECEQAVAHLLDCCPGFDARRLVCMYEGGCGSTVYPSLPLEESKCLEALDCASIRAGDYCVRAQNAIAKRTYDDEPDVAHEPVCP